MKLVCFDWGDTLMRVFPEEEGPMATWSRVEAMPGAVAALEGLAGRYRLAMLTSGGDSTEAQVRAALGRVGLGSYFEAVILSRDMGLAKSDPAFYRRALAALGCPAEEAVMVGDSYVNDVAPAKRAGMRAVLYLTGPDQAGRPETSPGGPTPDAVVGDLAELPGILAGW